MSTAERAPEAENQAGGTYEVLRTRLRSQADTLAEHAEGLNARRVEAFGSTELAVAGTLRIRTENNCIPRDAVPVGDRMLFGYNVFIGMKAQTDVDDVFSLHRFEVDGDRFEMVRVPAEDLPGLLRDPGFERDFAELYRYYRQAKLLQLRRVEDRLLAVFQIGPRIADTRVLRWRIGTDGSVEYLDNRGDRDHRFPPSHDLSWVETTRDDHVQGRFPHISIVGEVFVETVGGDLTIKIEDNTESGAGIYSEPVDEPLQSLADADVHYARVGPLILLRIRPYNESAWRYLIYNTRTREVARADGIGRACRRLPDDEGVIFPDGYYLATGVSRSFETDITDLEFERAIRSPNGEDVMYAFHARGEGRTLLLPYNVIRKEVAAPIPCHGYSVFADGTMVVFRAAGEEPTRVHPMQVWRTPYQSDTYAAQQPVGTGPLDRVGNADLVRGISDSLAVTRMIGDSTPTAAVFEAIIAAVARVLDFHHWLGEPEFADIREPLLAIRATAGQVLDEFENVQELTRQAETAVAESTERVAALIRQVRGEAPRGADAWVSQLAELRRAQGHLVTLRDVRYVDTGALDELTERLRTEFESAAGRAVEFLQQDAAFTEYHSELDGLLDEAGRIAKVADAEPLAARLAEQSEGLAVVTEVVGSLEIADATVRTAILERIGEVVGAVNRARATLDARCAELATSENRAAFAAEFALLGQAVTGALAVADTPGGCDDELARLLLQVENLEARFSGTTGDGGVDLLTELEAKRTDIYEAFTARKQSLLDERTRHADRLTDSATRILGTIGRRIAGLESLDDVNTYFASDPMVSRLRTVADELRELGDRVRAEELEGRIIAARQDAGRALRDRTDLYSGDGTSVRLGRHRFAVNTQQIELTLVPHDGNLTFGITATDYRSVLDDPAFADTRPLWDRLVVSESPEVYRAEYLAGTMLLAGSPALREAQVVDGGLLELVRREAGERYDEGYERGVHDVDAAAVLDTLLRLDAGAGLLRYPASARAVARLFWTYGLEPDARTHWSARIGSLARARAAFGTRPETIGEFTAELTDAIEEYIASAVTSASGSGPPSDPHTFGLAAEYLFEEVAGEPEGFITSAAARGLLDRFDRAIETAGPAMRKDLEADLRALPELADRYRLLHAWMESHGDASAPGDLAEAIVLRLCGKQAPGRESSATVGATVTGLLGSHPRIDRRSLTVRLDELLARIRRFQADDVPAYREFQRRRGEAIAAERERLRLSEYRPRPMSTFVRNRLLDEVYLPLIGDNLAKQIGASGDDRRADQMGLLLLISPPGYGKTTLMEYIADRLGLIFVKVNGPAIGSAVTSLDPGEAPNATARQEIEKISFALEMGDNVLLYLDDIQHTSPELLGKFISLCDAQRRIEGVWDGRTRTYDLRGKRFCVCMAGNPYTEAGQRFRIPDMLANRADVWNLGDVLSGREEQFALSYLENAFGSNQVTAPLTAGDRGDLDLLVRMARGEEGVQADQLTRAYSAVELDQILSVIAKMLTVQRTVLAVNRAYIASAAQDDDARTEPPFGLQGSYRNMNSLAERIVPVMNDDELQALIDDHYLGEAQTLASGAEANLLKLAELRGRLTAEEAARWTEVKAAYRRAKALGGSGDDPLDRAVGAIGLLADRVGSVETAITRATAERED